MRWFAVRTATRWELKASSELTRRGMENYLPLGRSKRNWSDRIKIINQPIFPGYIFVRFQPDDRIRVLEAPGVKQIVGIGHTPAPMEDSEIENLKKLAASHALLAPWPYLHAGQRIRVQRGPLAGVEGFVVSAGHDNLRIVVSVNLLQRSVAAEVDRECVEAV